MTTPTPESVEAYGKLVRAGIDPLKDYWYYSAENNCWVIHHWLGPLEFRKDLFTTETQVPDKPIQSPDLPLFQEG